MNQTEVLEVLGSPNIVTKNNNYSITQSFKVIDQDTTFIEKTHWMLIYLQENKI